MYRLFLRPHQGYATSRKKTPYTYKDWYTYTLR